MPRTLAQNAQYIAETIKPAIKSAIEAQGVTVPSTDSFLDYADRIGEIEGGGSGYQLKDLPSGSISTVNDAAELPLNALKVSVEAWQEGSGDPSPSNIRPIHGWSSGEIIATDGTVWNEQTEQGSINNNTGQDEPSTIQLRSVDYTPVLANTEYCLVRPQNTAVRLFYFQNDGEKTFISNELKSGDTNTYTTFTTPSSCGFIRFIIARQYGTTYNNDISINYPSSDTSYHAYQGTTRTVDFGQTLYSAKADLLNGNGYTDDVEVIPTILYDAGVPNSYGIVNIPFNTTGLNVDTNKPIMCNALPQQNTGFNVTQTEGIFVQSANQSYLRLLSSRGETKEEIIAFISQIGLKIRYKVTSDGYMPFTFTPIPTTKMRQGTNNIYADCGDVIEGEYFIGSSGAYDLYDYIQSDGTQYINTGRKLSSGDVIRCLYIPQSGNSNWNYVWASYDNNTVKGGLIFISSSIKAQYINGSETNRESYSDGTFYEDILTMTADSNGDTYVFSYAADTANCSYMRLYAFSINGDDYLPCKRRSDGKFGLYDVANSTFLTDSASGNAFVGGNNLGVRIG